MSKNRNDRRQASPIAAREVINERCEGCGKPGAWPLHSDGHSRLCPVCAQSFSSAARVAEAAKSATGHHCDSSCGPTGGAMATGGPVTPQGEESVVDVVMADRTPPTFVGEYPPRRDGVQKPEFSDIELAAMSFVLDNINSPVPPGLVEYIRSMKQKLTQYAKEKVA